MSNMKYLLLLALVACTENVPTSVPFANTLPPKDSVTPVAPVRHPAFRRDTTWNETNPGMTLVYESQEFAKPWSHQVVTDTLEAIRVGWKSQRFEVRPGDCFGTDCTRTPVYERNEFAQAYNENLEGDEYWYAWSFYVPVTPPSGGHWVYFAQFQQHYNYDSIWMFLKRPGQPFCALLDPKKNQYWTCDGTRGSNPLIDDTIFAGRWHDVMVHAKWTVNSDGFTKIYVDGRLVVNYQGYTRTSGNSDVYFKYGIYRHGSNNTSVVYYDEIRRGRTQNEVDIRLLEK